MSKEAMLSRSIRLHKDTLDTLHELARELDLGITVYIRKVLEAVVENTKNKEYTEI